MEPGVPTGVPIQTVFGGLDGDDKGSGGPKKSWSTQC